MIILYLTTLFSFISSKFFICLVWCKQVFLSYFSGTECLRWLVIVRYDVLMRFFNYRFIKLRKIPYFITPLHRVFIYRKNIWFSTYLLFLLSFFYLGLFLVSELVVGRIKWLGNTGNSRVLKIWFCFPLKSILPRCLGCSRMWLCDYFKISSVILSLFRFAKVLSHFVPKKWISSSTSSNLTI